ncbi:MAG: M20/M25/M40 family metallo-hydrolase [Clostridia bacterium]|nr:M20/M25/M40 family metallo-hydrolase [Clostridia bacterium]
MVELLKRLMLVGGVSGREDKIREAIIKEVEPYADEITVDPVGNLIVRKKGEGKKIMFCAHMDEIGFFASYIDDSGFIKVSAIGGINPVSCAFTEVVSENGVYGVIVPESSKETPKVDSMYIDIGAKNKKQAEKSVKIGDFFVCVPKMRKLLGTRYVGRPFDDRVGCAVLIEALKQIKEAKNDLYFVFSTQEEVGARGSHPATYTVRPDIGIALDVTGTGDKPGATPMAVKLGGGCTIKIKDSGVICSPTLVKEMRRIADDHKVKYQNEVLLYGGTDASSIQVAGTGAHVSVISIPSAFIHSGVEMIDMADVKEAVKLSVHLANEL